MYEIFYVFYLHFFFHSAEFIIFHDINLNNLIMQIEIITIQLYKIFESVKFFYKIYTLSYTITSYSYVTLIKLFIFLYDYKFYLLTSALFSGNTTDPYKICTLYLTLNFKQWVSG